MSDDVCCRFLTFSAFQGKPNENVLCIDVTPNELIFAKIASPKDFSWCFDVETFSMWHIFCENFGVAFGVKQLEFAETEHENNRAVGCVANLRTHFRDDDKITNIWITVSDFIYYSFRHTLCEIQQNALWHDIFFDVAHDERLCCYSGWTRKLLQCKLNASIFTSLYFFR